MKHVYLTETEIRKSLAAGAITDKEAKELIANLKRCTMKVTTRKLKGTDVNHV